jgi:hypothetical protein
MCVIAVARSVRLTEEQIERMWRANSHGGGVAWREERIDDDTGEIYKVVRWEKGLDVNDMFRIIPELPMPYVAHFRIASSGDVCDELTHPFPIDTTADLVLKGETRGQVFFHNGTLSKWRDYLLEVALRGGHKIPSGRWNDTRTMAWIAGILGVPICDIFDQKIVAFGPTFETTNFFGKWEAANEGLFVSNKGWELGTTYYGAGYMGPHRTQGEHVNPHQTVADTNSGGNGNGTASTDPAVTVLPGVEEVTPDQDPFPGGATSVFGGGNQQQPVQTGAESVGSTASDVCNRELKEWALSRQSGGHPRKESLPRLLTGNVASVEAIVDAELERRRAAAALGITREGNI